MTRSVFISAALFLWACGEEQVPQQAEPLPARQEVKSADTLHKSADTIVIKDRERIDTLVRYRALRDTDYYVKPEPITRRRRLDFSGYEYRKKYITRTKRGVKEEGVNFAGHYCFVFWGCGSPCKLSAVVDLKTGKVYNAPPSGLGYRFKKNSRLLVVNPPHEGWYNLNVPYAIPEEYEWTGKEFRRLTNNAH